MVRINIIASVSILGLSSICSAIPISVPRDTVSVRHAEAELPSTHEHLSLEEREACGCGLPHNHKGHDQYSQLPGLKLGLEKGHQYQDSNPPNAGFGSANPGFPESGGSAKPIDVRPAKPGSNPQYPGKPSGGQPYPGQVPHHGSPDSNKPPGVIPPGVYPPGMSSWLASNTASGIIYSALSSAISSTGSSNFTYTATGQASSASETSITSASVTSGSPSTTGTTVTSVSLSTSGSATSGSTTTSTTTVLSTSTTAITSTTSISSSMKPTSTYTTTAKAIGAEPSGNPITRPGLNEIVPAGKDYTVVWEPTTPGKITLLLLRGPAENIEVMYPLVEGLDNTGSFTWHVSADLEPDHTHYGIQLIDESNGQFQYTTQFGIRNDAFTGKVTASIPAATSTSSVAPVPLSTFNPRASNNLVAWWGQNGAAPLSDFCKDGTYDVINLAFLNEFVAAGGYPKLNLGTWTHTFPQTPAQKAAGATDLWEAKDVAADIKKCQDAGKKIFLTLGGASGKSNAKLVNDEEAIAFADMVWNLFLGGKPQVEGLRPFGNIVLDGVDINNESFQTGSYATYISRLRSNMDANAAAAPGGQFFMSGTVWPCDHIQDSPNLPFSSFPAMDFITVQFYNSGATAACRHVTPPSSTSGFSTWVQKWSSALTGNTRLLVGGLSVEKGQSGFLDTADLVKEIEQVKGLGLKNLAGYALWDATYAKSLNMDVPVKKALSS